jgi:hypothetical protein
VKVQLFLMSVGRKVFSPEEFLGPIAWIFDGVKAFVIPAQGAQEIRQPQPNYPFQKLLETAPLGQRQLHRIKGPHGLLNPEESLLVRVFKLPGSKPLAPDPAGEGGFEQVPVPTRQFIPGWLAMCFPR